MTTQLKHTPLTLKQKEALLGDYLNINADDLHVLDESESTFTAFDETEDYKVYDDGRIEKL